MTNVNCGESRTSRGRLPHTPSTSSRLCNNAEFLGEFGRSDLVRGKSRDSDYFRRRAAEARAACSNGRGEQAEIAGELALAYAALARRRAETDTETLVAEIPPAEVR
jgi:hypothetical protein